MATYISFFRKEGISFLSKFKKKSFFESKECKLSLYDTDETLVVVKINEMQIRVCNDN